jgi:hypothetical protein
MVFTSSYGASGELKPPAFSRHSHVADQLEHGRHVVQARHVVQHHGIGREQGSAQLRQRRVFGTRNFDGAGQ